MQFLRNFIALCRFLAAGFRRWFMPLPMKDLEDEEEEAPARKEPARKKIQPQSDIRPVAKSEPTEAKPEDDSPEVDDDAEADVDPTPEEPVDVQEAEEPEQEIESATEEDVEDGQANHRRRIIEILTLSNSRRINHLARGTGLPEDECRRIVSELIEEGVIVPGRAGWRRLAAERRLSLLETNAQLYPVLDTLTDDSFRREALETLFDLLENYRISLQPRRKAVNIMLQGKRAAQLTFNPALVMVKLNGAFDARFADLVERVGGSEVNQSEDGLTFEWNAGMSSSKVASLLRDAFEQRIRTMKRPTPRRTPKRRSPSKPKKQPKH